MPKRPERKIPDIIRVPAPEGAKPLGLTELSFVLPLELGLQAMCRGTPDQRPNWRPDRDIQDVLKALAEAERARSKRDGGSKHRPTRKLIERD